MFVCLMFEECFTASVAASISRQFMCHVLLDGDYGPPVPRPWEVAPQPVRKASDSIARSAFLSRRDFPLHLARWCAHQLRSALVSSESGHCSIVALVALPYCHC